MYPYVSTMFATVLDVITPILIFATLALDVYVLYRLTRQNNVYRNSLTAAYLYIIVFQLSYLISRYVLRHSVLYFAVSVLNIVVVYIICLMEIQTLRVFSILKEKELSPRFFKYLTGVLTVVFLTFLAPHMMRLFAPVPSVNESKRSLQLHYSSSLHCLESFLIILSSFTYSTWSLLDTRRKQHSLFFKN
jgi:hypothetical protein